MANDRMFLRNKITGQQLMIAKHYCSGWYIPDPQLFLTRLQNFLEGLDIDNPVPLVDYQDPFFKYHHLYEITYEDYDVKDNKCTGCGALLKLIKED